MGLQHGDRCDFQKEDGNRMTTRFTIHDLRNIVELCNQRLERHGCKVRIEERSRNGRYVTESFPIDETGDIIDSGYSRIGSGAVARAVARVTLAWTRHRINHRIYRQRKVDGASRRTQYHAAADRGKPPNIRSRFVSAGKSHRTQYHASYDGRDVMATVVVRWVSHPSWTNTFGLGKRARH